MTLISNMAGPCVGLLGDSITHLGDFSVDSAVSTIKDCRGYWSWVQVLMGFPAYAPAGNPAAHPAASNPLGYNQGWSGGKLADMATRYNDLFAFLTKPSVVIVLGGTNDISGAASSYSAAQATFAAMTAAMTTIVSGILANGAIPVVVPVLPRNTDGVGGNDFTGPERVLLAQFNSWLEAYIGSTIPAGGNNPRARLTNPYKYWCDPTSASGSATAGLTYDGLHPSAMGAYWIAQALIPILTPLLLTDNTGFWSQVDTYDVTTNPNPYGNMLLNGLLTGTGGTVTSPVTGTAATNWTAEKSAGSVVTAVASIVTKAVGPNTALQQQLIVSSPGGGTLGTTEQIRFRQFGITNGVSAGNWYEAECLIEVDAPTVTGLVTGVYLELKDTTSSGALMRCFSDDTYSSTQYAPYPSLAWTGKFKTPPLQAVGTTGLRLTLYIDVDGSKVGSVTVRCSNMCVRPMQVIPPYSY